MLAKQKIQTERSTNFIDPPFPFLLLKGENTFQRLYIYRNHQQAATNETQHKITQTNLY